MTIDTTAFAWLEIPSSALGSAFGVDIHFGFDPGGASPDADNVTPPRPRTLLAANPKTVWIRTHGGKWSVSGNVGNFRVAGGPQSEVNDWPDPQDQASWAGDENVLLIAVRYKPS
jgi:hypothetical protein